MALTALKVGRETRPGMYADGEVKGLYLQVSGAGAKSWILRYRTNKHLSSKGRPLSREMGLGSVQDVSLAQAREDARRFRRQAREGIDPIEARRAERARNALASANAITFKAAAESYIASHRAGWRNIKHAGQWTATLQTYAYPVLGALPMGAVDVGLVLRVLEPIWTAKPETASRVRGRIECILDWAKVRGYRDGENPARWKGHLDHLLPPRAKVAKVEHHAALPYSEIAAFMADLCTREGVAARALQFVILTAARSGEVRGARWSEIDLDARVWTIPGERMKSGREHRVPLSEPAVALLRIMSESRDGDLIFPGIKSGRPLSDMSMTALLRRIGRGDLTVHGFRSTFADWAAERTNFPREVREMALAHAVGDAVEAAYRRGDLFDKRRRLMDAWAEFIGDVRPGSAVVPLRPAQA